MKKTWLVCVASNVGLCWSVLSRQCFKACEWSAAKLNFEEDLGAVLNPPQVVDRAGRKGLVEQGGNMEVLLCFLSYLEQLQAHTRECLTAGCSKFV